MSNCGILDEILLQVRMHRQSTGLLDTSLHDADYVLVENSSFWTKIFSNSFLTGGCGKPVGYCSATKDDMLFYVIRSEKKKNEVQETLAVYRRASKCLPSLGDVGIAWQETVCINLIMHHLKYSVTLAVCSRTGEKQLQILRKHSEVVYPSPSRRRMDQKGTTEKMCYPQIFFALDNFEEVFTDIVVRDPELLCVELVCRSLDGALRGILFLGSVPYESVKRAYEAKKSFPSRWMQDLSIGLWRNTRRIEFIKMRGPNDKGIAEVAISRVPGTGVETPQCTPLPTPSSTPGPSPFGSPMHTPVHKTVPTKAFSISSDTQPLPGVLERSSSFHSDSSKSARNSFPSRVRRKSGDFLSREKWEDDVISGCDAKESLANDTGPTSFGKSWHFWKESRRQHSVALTACLTYISVSWQQILEDILGETKEPLLTF